MQNAGKFNGIIGINLNGKFKNASIFFFCIRIGINAYNVREAYSGGYVVIYKKMHRAHIYTVHSRYLFIVDVKQDQFLYG